MIYRTKVPYPHQVREFFEAVTGAAGIERYTADGVFIQFEAEDDYDLHGQVKDLEDTLNSNFFESLTIPRPEVKA